VATAGRQAPTETDGGLTSRGERTRQRLLEVSVRRFAERGYRETSLSAIAREAGVSPAAVYAYTSGKEALLLAAFEYDVERLFQKAMPRSAGEQTPWVGVVARAVAALPEHPLAHRVLRGLEPELTPRLPGMPSLGRLRAALERSLRSGQEDGTVRADIDPARIAVGLEVLLVSTLLASVQSESSGDPVRREGVLALLAAALLQPAALLPPAAPVPAAAAPEEPA
jgi:AcrR family transcriptional regulator